MQVTLTSNTYGPQTVLFDEADLPIVQQYKWHVFRVHQTFYARASNGGKFVYMHRLFVGEEAGPIDHKNGNGLDNRRENLRQCTPSQNSMNRAKNTTKRSSKYKGVYPDLLPGRTGWTAKIGVKGKKIYIGHFESEEEAAKAYDREAIARHGKYARLNLP